MSPGDVGLGLVMVWVPVFLEVSEVFWAQSLCPLQSLRLRLGIIPDSSVAGPQTLRQFAAEALGGGGDNGEQVSYQTPRSRIGDDGLPGFHQEEQ